jgi:CelD/BcsL family acetyltransferase involved in cellulose biosynthesis
VVRALGKLESRNPVRVHGTASRCSTRIVVQGSWEDYLATRSKHTQREWRRKRKRLDEAGAVEIRTVRTAEDLPRGLEEVLDIESRSWKHVEGTSFQREAGVEEFYRRLAGRCAARGWLRLSLLYLAGRPTAHCLAVVHGNEMLALKTSFDASLANLSPGLALMLALCEQAFRDGLGAIDLLGHPDRWKLEMATDQRTHVDLCVFPRGLMRCEMCVAYEDKIEPVLREKLPPRIADIGRRALARLRHSS